MSLRSIRSETRRFDQLAHFEKAKVSFVGLVPEATQGLIHDIVDALGPRFPIGWSSLVFEITSDARLHGATLSNFDSRSATVKFNPAVFPRGLSSEATEAHLASTLFHEIVAHARADLKVFSEGSREVGTEADDHRILFQPGNLDENEYYQCMLDVYFGLGSDSELESSVMTLDSAPEGGFRKLFLQHCADDIANTRDDIADETERAAANRLLDDIYESHEIEPLRSKAGSERLATGQSSRQWPTPSPSALSASIASLPLPNHPPVPLALED